MTKIPAALRRQSAQICLALLAYLLAGQLLGMLARAALPASRPAVWTALAALLVRLLSIILPILLLVFLEPPAMGRWFCPVPGGWFCRGLISFLGCCLVVLLLNYALARIPQLLGFAPVAADTAPLPAGAAGLLLTYLGIAAVPALLEEFLFRGLILRRLLPFGARFAVLTSALLFALLHRDLIRLPGIFLMGAFLGQLAAQSGSLLPGIFLHLLNNTLALTLRYLDRAAPESARALQLFFLVVCALCAVAAFVGFLLQCPARKTPFDMELRGVGTLPRFFAGIPAIAFLLVWLLSMALIGG